MKSHLGLPTAVKDPVYSAPVLANPCFRHPWSRQVACTCTFAFASISIPSSFFGVKMRNSLPGVTECTHTHTQRINPETLSEKCYRLVKIQETIV